MTSRALDAGLRDVASRAPDSPVLKHANGTCTSYGELENRANRYAHLLRRCGLSRGEHVAGVLGNGPDILALAWACYRSGLYFTPVATTLAAHEMAYVVGNCEARLVVADHRYGGIARRLPVEASRVTRFFSVGGAIDGFDPVEDALAILPEQPIEDESPGAIMLYSSGTTGTPKGIWRPLPTLEDVGDGQPLFVRDVIATFDLRPADRYLSTGPLYHAAPLRWSLAVTAIGGCVYIMDKFDADVALTLLEREKITVSQWVPTMLHRLLALPEERRAAIIAPEHRAAYHAAAPISIGLKQAMIDWWGPIINEYYGGSESVGFCMINTEEWLQRPGSVGRAYKGELHILDENSRELPVGEAGRIFFSGTSRFEYYGEPEKTAARTSAQGYQTFGDVGYVDADGYLFLTDRLDDVIISGGVNIYPQEIEHMLERAPGVEEAGVVGQKDPEFGERTIAFVKPRPDVHDLERLREDLTAYCREWLGRTKQPKEIRFVDALPHSEAGKLLRRILREQANAAS